MVLAQHWNETYDRLGDVEVSWYEPTPATSREMLRSAGVRRSDAVVDVGAGTSRLVDRLLAEGFTDLTALDISSTALAISRARIGPAAADVEWLVADVLDWRPTRRFTAWHDRAVFHFLVDDADRRRYLEVLSRVLQPSATVLIGAFAEDGPGYCSGLPTVRYAPGELASALGAALRPIREVRVVHRTPQGIDQPFTWLTARTRW